MQFLYPWVLWFSFLAVIPIIIHLFYFRRYKTVYFSQTSLLESVIKKSRSQQKLRNLLILLLRILFILLLVLAFAQPHIKDHKVALTNESDAYVLYIDNSFSMNDEGEQGVSLLEEAKSKALTFVQSLPKQNKYFLLYHGQKHSADKLFSSEEVLKKITEISVAPTTEKWSEIFRRIKQILEQRKLHSKVPIVWFSDGQKYAVDYTQWEKDSLIINWFYLKHAKNSNISIDSIWFEQPQHIINNREKLWVSLTNHGIDDVANLPVKLYINDTLKATATVNLTAKNSEILTFDFLNTRSGWQNGKIEIADFPITFDNTYFFTYYVYQSLKVAVLSEQIPSFLQAFFKSDSTFSPVFIAWNNASSKILSNKQAILLFNTSNIATGLWAELIDLVKKGKSLVLVPSTSLQLSEINLVLQSLGVAYSSKDTLRQLLSINSLEQEFFKGLFTRKEERLNMPWASVKYPIRIHKNIVYDVILRFENGDNALVQIKHEKGNIYLFSFPIQQQTTNLHVHPLFVALLHRMMEKSLQTTELAYTLRHQLSFSASIDTIINDKPLSLKNIYTQATQVPLQQFRFNEINISPIVIDLESGIYSLIQEEKEVMRLAFNFPRKESEMNFYTSQDIESFFKEKGYYITTYETNDLDVLKYAIINKHQGIALWKWLLGLSIMILIAEMLLIRFWKVV